LRGNLDQQEPDKVAINPGVALKHFHIEGRRCSQSRQGMQALAVRNSSPEPYQQSTWNLQSTAKAFKRRVFFVAARFRWCEVCVRVLGVTLRSDSDIVNHIAELQRVKDEHTHHLRQSSFAACARPSRRSREERTTSGVASLSVTVMVPIVR
jgi:hypothetical protein